MSTTRYKIRLWEYDGEASVANAVTFDSFDEAQARFNDLRVSEEMPCVEFIKERIANGCIIGDEVLNVRQFTSVFDAITKDKPTLAGFLRSLPCIEAPWDAAFQKRYCSSCTAENCDACANEQFRNKTGKTGLCGTFCGCSSQFPLPVHFPFLRAVPSVSGSAAIRYSRPVSCRPPFPVL